MKTKGIETRIITLEEYSKRYALRGGWRETSYVKKAAATCDSVQKVVLILLDNVAHFFPDFELIRDKIPFSIVHELIHLLGSIRSERVTHALTLICEEYLSPRVYQKQLEWYVPWWEESLLHMKKKLERSIIDIET